MIPKNTRYRTIFGTTHRYTLATTVNDDCTSSYSLYHGYSSLVATSNNILNLCTHLHTEDIIDLVTIHDAYNFERRYNNFKTNVWILTQYNLAYNPHHRKPTDRYDDIYENGNPLVTILKTYGSFDDGFRFTIQILNHQNEMYIIKNIQSERLINVGRPTK